MKPRNEADWLTSAERLGLLALLIAFAAFVLVRVHG
jgi:hypothetical protein